MSVVESNGFPARWAALQSSQCGEPSGLVGIDLPLVRFQAIGRLHFLQVDMVQSARP